MLCLISYDKKKALFMLCTIVYRVRTSSSKNQGCYQSISTGRLIVKCRPILLSVEVNLSNPKMGVLLGMPGEWPWTCLRTCTRIRSTSLSKSRNPKPEFSRLSEIFLPMKTGPLPILLTYQLYLSRCSRNGSSCSGTWQLKYKSILHDMTLHRKITNWWHLLLCSALSEND